MFIQSHLPANKLASNCPQDKYGPVGLIHVDAHKDMAEHMYGCEIVHGTP